MVGEGVGLEGVVGEGIGVEGVIGVEGGVGVGLEGVVGVGVGVVGVDIVGRELGVTGVTFKVGEIELDAITEEFRVVVGTKTSLTDPRETEFVGITVSDFGVIVGDTWAASTGLGIVVTRPGITVPGSGIVVIFGGINVEEIIGSVPVATLGITVLCSPPPSLQ